MPSREHIIDERDLRVSSYTTGFGRGDCEIVHIPTGIRAYCNDHEMVVDNRRAAMDRIRAEFARIAKED